MSYPPYSFTGSSDYLLNHPNYADHYVAPGIPWVTSSTFLADGVVSYLFPYVTDFFVLTNTSPSGSGDIRSGWSAAGVTSSNYFTLEAQQSMELNVRCQEVFLSGTTGVNYELIAGLSSAKIHNRRTFPFTGYPGI